MDFGQREVSQRKQISKRGEHQVLIGGGVYLYQAKAPFQVSGVSILGGLEYDEADETVKCHECGVWMKGLASHIGRVHGMTTRAYKLKHGLKISTALVGEKTRATMINNQIARCQAARKAGKPLGIADPATNQRAKKLLRAKAKGGKLGGSRRAYGTAEGQNQRKLCAAQLLDKIRSVATAVGGVPSVRQLEESLVPRSAVTFHFGTHNQALAAAGINGRQESGERYSSDQLLKFMRTVMEAKHRNPSKSDYRRGLLPSQPTYSNRFGSWERAIRLAKKRDDLDVMPNPAIWRKEKRHYAQAG